MVPSRHSPSRHLQRTLNVNLGRPITRRSRKNATKIACTCCSMLSIDYISGVPVCRTGLLKNCYLGYQRLMFKSLATVPVSNTQSKVLAQTSPASSFHCVKSRVMRHPTSEDVPSIIDLAQAIKLFDSNEEINELIRQPLEEYLAAGSAAADGSAQWWVSDSSEGSGIACASFTGPQDGEHGAFNMYFLGVRPELQKSGLGAAMVAKVEQWAKQKQNAVRILVETACQMDGAQTFYKKQGYVERKRMKDMYGEGIDAVQFAKEL